MTLACSDLEQKKGAPVFIPIFMCCPIPLHSGALCRFHECNKYFEINEFRAIKIQIGGYQIVTWKTSGAYFFNYTFQ